jgi:hypothetical protein
MAVELIEGPARLQATCRRCQSTIAFGAAAARELGPSGPAGRADNRLTGGGYPKLRPVSPETARHLNFSRLQIDL